MENRLITEIEQQMMGILNNAQLMQLQKVLEHCFYNYEVVKKSKIPSMKVEKTANY